MSLDSLQVQSNVGDMKAYMLMQELFRMGTTFWLSANNKESYAHMSRGPLECVATVIFEDGALLSIHILKQKKARKICSKIHQIGGAGKMSIYNGYLYNESDHILKINPVTVKLESTQDNISNIAGFFFEKDTCPPPPVKLSCMKSYSDI